MKIFLLLVLKCLLYSKITGNRLYQSEIRDISSEKIELGQNDVEVNSVQRCFRIKRELSIRDPSIFELAEPDRSPRRKRAVLRKKNQIFFRRHKKKMERKSKIRKSLMRRGKFTTATPYRNNMKKYLRGKGKIVRPPGLKYRKRYRFNRFKKTQDVALGLGGDGMAQFKKSAPKKRPPIHVRDYERGRRTRKAFRGRVGERKSPDANRRRAEPKGSRRKGAAKVRDTAHQSKEYYDESGDYGSDSLPKQTKARKSFTSFGKTTKRKKVIKPLKIKDSNYEYSRDDNTLLLSDEDQLTDISSEIEAQRSELSDERPKHRKNASSSEYEQYSFADDDSAIVKGEVVSSKEESEQRVSFPRKSTLLGSTNYEQYDINKLDASMERVFKKKKFRKENEAKLGLDDPWENLEDAYKDESSYEDGSEIEEGKRKGKKSKTQVKKGRGKLKPPKKNQERKTKSGKVQTKAKSETDTEEYSYDESEEYSDAESGKHNTNDSEEYDTDKSGEYDDEEYDGDESEEYDDEEYDGDESEEYDDEEYDGEKSGEYDDEDYEDESTSKDHETSYEDVEVTSVDDKASSEKEHSKGKSSNKTEEYNSDEYESDEYSTYEETTPPIRRIPTWKITQYSTKEKFYEEYTDTDDETNFKPDFKNKKVSKGAPGKTTSKIKISSKKGHETSTYDSEEHYSEEYSQSKSSLKDKSKKNKTSQMSKKNLNTGSSTKKNQDTSEYSESESQIFLKSSSKAQKAIQTRKMSFKTDVTVKSDQKGNQHSSEFSSDYYDSSESSESTSDEKAPKKESLKSSTKSKKSTLSTKIIPKTVITSKKKSKTEPAKTKSAPPKKQDILEFSSDYYDTETSNEHHSDQRSQEKDSAPSKKASETSTDISYDSDYSTESDEKPTAKSIKAPKKGLKISSTKKIAFSKKWALNKKSKITKSKATAMFESQDRFDKKEEEDSRILKSFGLDDDYKKRTLNFSISEEIGMIKYAKAHSLPPIEIMNTKIQGLDIFRAEHEQKYDLSLSESKAGTPSLASYDTVSDYSHDDTEESRELKSFGLEDFKAPSSGKTTAGKEILEKGGKKQKNLAKQTTLKKSPVKTTKKSKAKKNLETYESDYSSEITSYEQSSNEASQSKKILPKQILSPNKGHETSYDEPKDLDSKTDHTEKHSEDRSLRSHKDEKETTRDSVSKKTTLTTKRRKKGFTTLPSTTKGFDSEEALKKISSKAAAITKKHVFVYNTKKKAYELVRVDSSQSQGITGQFTLYNSPAHKIFKDSNQNSTKTLRSTEKTLRKRIVRKKTTPEVLGDLPESSLEIKSTRKRSRKTTQST